ncbi:MAG: PrsW family intramembrane metalloprotease [Clostridia bacterium]|nr:PrsW family intramembrane metalloprotease [Clostridia bacterium]
MENLIYILFVSVFVPIMLMACLIESKARQPIVFVLIGIYISVFAAEINGLLRNVLPLSTYEVTTIVAPITEELLKAVPILIYATVIGAKKEKLFTASMAVGIGFAVLENAYYLLNDASFNMFDAIIRAFGAGLMHGMCTLLVGVGISFVKKKSKIFVVGTFALLSTAITYHGIYNMLIQSKFEVIGFLLPISTYIPFAVWRIKNQLSKKNSNLS